uniref:Uncharacterized protein n=1 Tax=Caenorhabditis japonica TaxID=281687 RepID=A0A8R1IHM0_CAEJA
MQARACQSLLFTPQKKELLVDLVTGGDSWVLYNNDTQRAVWIPRGEEPPVQPKANLHEKKCVFSCFWDAKGMLYNKLLPQGRKSMLLPTPISLPRSHSLILPRPLRQNYRTRCAKIRKCLNCSQWSALAFSMLK